MALTNEQMLASEEAIIGLSKATGLSEKEIIEVLQDGFFMKYKGKIPDELVEIIDELIATFDAY